MTPPIAESGSQLRKNCFSTLGHTQRAVNQVRVCLCSVQPIPYFRGRTRRLRCLRSRPGSIRTASLPTWCRLHRCRSRCHRIRHSRRISLHIHCSGRGPCTLEDQRRSTETKRGAPIAKRPCQKDIRNRSACTYSLVLFGFLVGSYQPRREGPQAKG